MNINCGNRGDLKDMQTIDVPRAPELEGPGPRVLSTKSNLQSDYLHQFITVNLVPFPKCFLDPIHEDSLFNP